MVKGTKDVTIALQALIDSPAHRKHILAEDWFYQQQKSLLKDKFCMMKF